MQRDGEREKSGDEKRREKERQVLGCFFILFFYSLPFLWNLMCELGVDKANHDPLEDITSKHSTAHHIT